ncbi:MAG: Unknown protein [uncultured Sulfurovum sp.]|uniref:histidine kinase n=1 Tax=uncultured Sulfurovum sp. TaxID=269237 RepID=A0A6S6SK31_9BACT|nr:MAG: Unknown protein [uncultured Sulfurovum sp.]
MSEIQINQLLIKQIEDIYGKGFDFSRAGGKVKDLLEKINNSYNNLEYQSKQNNILFEEEENIVFTIGMSAGVIRANKKFFKTFGFQNLADFKKDYSCICELFIEDEGYLKETTAEVHWTEPIFRKPDIRHKALIKDFNGDKRVYAVLLKEVILETSKLKICTFTDITELEEALSTSRKSEEIKTAFMANMSHEIRTPMNGIIGFTNLLFETELTPQQQQFLELIDESTILLSKIVDDILDFSEMENSSVELDYINVDIFTDCYSFMSLFKTKALEKNLSYRVQIDPDISKSLLMDKSKVVKVISNLISNAIKFTPEGGEILIDIQRLESTENSELISFAVTDTGIGIDQCNMDNIFKSFRQADSSLSKEFAGAGLGLSIAKSLCNVMNSDLKVKSILGEGSTFSFELSLTKTSKQSKLIKLTEKRPIYVIENQSKDYDDVIYQLKSSSINFIPLSTNEMKASGITNHIVIIFDYEVLSSLKLDYNKVLLIDGSKDASLCAKIFENIYHINSFLEFPSELYAAILDLNNLLNMDKSSKSFDLNILVADDDRLNRILLDEMLLGYDIKADFVEDGVDAIVMAFKNSYDLILMDINMPKINGVEANEILKDKGITVPIVAVTANVLKGDKERLLNLGLDDYISKPISTESLYNILLKYSSTLIDID